MSAANAFGFYDARCCLKPEVCGSSIELGMTGALGMTGGFTGMTVGFAGMTVGFTGMTVGLRG
ncbi:hypothetical protein [Zhongshania arctica]|uniref:Uncharacterized protein n=1 Tax=Zhongshania arctica TaxID=3238302 RepID=A0ABV3TS78_9GAMM